MGTMSRIVDRIEYHRVDDDRSAHQEWGARVFLRARCFVHGTARKDAPPGALVVKLLEKRIMADVYGELETIFEVLRRHAINNARPEEQDEVRELLDRARAIMHGEQEDITYG